MRAPRVKAAAGIAVAGVLAVSGAAAAGDGRDGPRHFKTVLTGYEEIAPAGGAVSTTGNGDFEARLTNVGDQVRWELRYADLEGAVQQAHIHFGQRHTNGGISVFLCTNLGNRPGAQACPPAPQGTSQTVTGTFGPADVIGPEGQGIEPGAFDELLAAMRAEVTYVNVHSVKWPSGEIRGQLDRGRQR